MALTELLDKLVLDVRSGSFKVGEDPHPPISRKTSSIGVTIKISETLVSRETVSSSVTVNHWAELRARPCEYSKIEWTCFRNQGCCGVALVVGSCWTACLFHTLTYMLFMI